MKPVTVLSFCICVLASSALAWLLYAQDAGVDSLAMRTAVLNHKIQLLEDENAVENLQRAYGFYSDKNLWTQISDLFTQDASVEFSMRGVVVGRQHIKEFLGVFGPESIAQGAMNSHLQLQPVVHVAEDGKTAKGRWRVLQLNGVWQQSANWGGGIYENEYVKEDGVWKISKLKVYNTFFVDYDTGWEQDAYPHAGPREGFTADLPPSENYGIYPEVHIAPFHYSNPVGGL